MKIIVNEHQYSLIKEFIDEAKKKYPQKSQEKMGDFLDKILEKTKVGSVLVFSVGSSTFSLECTLANKPKYSFKVIEDKDNILNKQKIINLNLKDGNSPLEIYQKNSNKVTYNSISDTYGLLIPNLKKEIYNIKDIKFLAKQEPQPEEPQPEEPQPEEPQPEEPQPEEPTSGDTEQPSTDKLKKDAEKTYSSIINDPILKKAFYEQPSLFKLFVAELQGKQAVGKGIITVMDLVRKYHKKKLQKFFIEFKKVTIVFEDDYKLNYGKNDEYSQLFTKNKEYPMSVMRHRLGEGVKLKNDKSFVFQNDNTLGFILKLEDFKDEEKDEFYCRIYFYVEEKNETGDMKKYKYDVYNQIIVKVIRGDKSLGYKGKVKQK